MAAYPTDGSMADVLIAMKNKIRQKDSQMRYLDDCRITARGYWDPTIGARMIYLVPIGTVPINIGEYGAYTVWRFQHRVRIESVVHSGARQDSEVAIVGSNAEAGVCDMVSDAISFFENNWLGLAGLDPGIAPECQEDGDTSMRLTDDDETIYFNVGRVNYQATTVPHQRPTDS